MKEQSTIFFTKKTREDFESWFTLHYDYELSEFYEMPLSMQIGVAVDFYESKEIIIHIEPTDHFLLCYNLYINNKKVNSFADRDETRKEALVKSNQKHNNK
ncbi:hypothetical protein [Aquimarina macrocephali]|uniref:hypothetical protein n=1 Tax=Aquimarina macrocephali TaxID=666563 RepID=UPI003F66FA62